MAVYFMQKISFLMNHSKNIFVFINSIYQKILFISANYSDILGDLNFYRLGDETARWRMPAFDLDQEVNLFQNDSKNHLTDQNEVTYVDVSWTTKLDTAAAMGYQHIPNARNVTYPKTYEKGLVIYKYITKPDPSDCLGIWLTCTQRPYRGKLHFPHEYLQKQPNFAIKPFAMQVWNTFGMINEHNSLLEFSRESERSVQPVKYTHDEASTLAK